MQQTTILFWQHMLSIHQAPLISELAALSNHKVILMATSAVPSERTRQGWDSGNFGQAEVIVAPSSATILQMAMLPAANTVHIVSGLRHEIWKHKKVLDHWNGHRPKVLIYSEPWDERGIRGRLRTVAFRQLARTLNPFISGVLATGGLAKSQFIRAGFTDVFPFAYFVLPSQRNDSRVNGVGANISGKGIKSRPSEFLYVGTFESRKNVTGLVRSFKTLPKESRLTIVGSGSQQSRLLRLCNSPGIRDRVRILGNVPNLQVRDYMANADVLVLPSLYDGWGAVVNEALTEGTAVLVSQSCGSVELLRSSIGSSFNPTKSGELKAQLHQINNMVQNSKFDRENIACWADKCISPKSGARYLHAIIGYLTDGSARPAAPWIKDPETEAK